MENVNIVMTRIDERLLHGQGQLWLRYIGANTILVVNDEVAKDLSLIHISEPTRPY